MQYIYNYTYEFNDFPYVLQTDLKKIELMSQNIRKHSESKKWSIFSAAPGFGKSELSRTFALKALANSNSQSCAIMTSSHDCSVRIFDCSKDSAAEIAKDIDKMSRLDEDTLIKIGIFKEFDQFTEKQQLLVKAVVDSRSDYFAIINTNELNKINYRIRSRSHVFELELTDEEKNAFIKKRFADSAVDASSHSDLIEKLTENFDIRDVNEEIRFLV